MLDYYIISFLDATSSSLLGNQQACARLPSGRHLTQLRAIINIIHLVKFDILPNWQCILYIAKNANAFPWVYDNQFQISPIITLLFHYFSWKLTIWVSFPSIRDTNTQKTCIKAAISPADIVILTQVFWYEHFPMKRISSNIVPNTVENYETF